MFQEKEQKERKKSFLFDMHALNEWLDVSRQTHAYVLLWVFGDFGTKSVCVCAAHSHLNGKGFFSRNLRA